MVSKLIAESELVDFGHHLILGISGTTLSEEDKKILESVRPIGILLLARNFCQGLPYESWLESLKTLIADIKRYTGRASMFISLDHEGGGVVRTPNPITRFPYASVLRGRAFEVAQATARELLSLGVNVSWAPVADVHSNPHNPIIGARAFSSEPDEVAEYACAYARGLAEAGVIGCAKHFPGHGDTSTDSHLELPVLPISRETLLQRELVPFIALCRQKIPMVMTAHVLFPAIDPVEPATFSRTIIAELLRGELGYEGIIVSDDLEMRAINSRIEQEGAIAEPFNAGCDMAIVARYLQPKIDHVLAMAQSFSKNLRKSSGFFESITASRERIYTLLRATPMPTVEPLSKEILQDHARLAIEVTLWLERWATRVKKFSSTNRARLLSILAEEYPDARSALNFVDDYQLIVAVVLSAQCTDKKVNEVTPNLFDKWPSFESLAVAEDSELEATIRPINYYRSKARNIKGLAEAVLVQWGGRLPDTIDELVSLPGVGRKTANVVVSERGTEAGLAVDTHVFRVSRRLGISQGESAGVVEEELRRAFSPSHWRSLHHRLILHGRAVCKARRPQCEVCCLRQICNHFRSHQGRPSC